MATAPTLKSEPKGDAPAIPQIPGKRIEASVVVSGAPFPWRGWLINGNRVFLILKKGILNNRDVGAGSRRRHPGQRAIMKGGP